MAFHIPKVAYTKLFRWVQIKGSIQKIKNYPGELKSFIKVKLMFTTMLVLGVDARLKNDADSHNSKKE